MSAGDGVIVRCGRCKAELEVAGPGEFLCPACGTRNVVRAGAGANLYGVSDLTGPGAGPGAGPPPGGSQTAKEAAGVRWATCPACGYRFAMGEVDTVTCPNCRAQLDRANGGALSPSQS